MNTNTPANTFTFTYTCGAGVNPDAPVDRIIATVRVHKYDDSFDVEILNAVWEDTQESVRNHEWDWLDNADGIRQAAGIIYQRELDALSRSEDPRHVEALALCLSVLWGQVEHDELVDRFNFIGGQRVLAREALDDARALCVRDCEGFAGFDEEQQARCAVRMLHARIEEVAKARELPLALGDWSYWALMGVLGFHKTAA